MQGMQARVHGPGALHPHTRVGHFVSIEVDGLVYLDESIACATASLNSHCPKVPCLD